MMVVPAFFYCARPAGFPSAEFRHKAGLPASRDCSSDASKATFVQRLSDAKPTIVRLLVVIALAGMAGVIEIRAARAFTPDAQLGFDVLMPHSSAAAAASFDAVAWPFTGKSNEPPMAPLDRRIAANSQADGGDVERLFTRAENDYLAGDVAAAEAQFESLIARFPDSGRAGDARQRLLAIYRAEKEAAVQKRPVGQAGGAKEPSAPAEAPTATPVSPEQPARRLTRDGDDFQLAVGDRVFFEPSSAVLSPADRMVLTAQAHWLKARPETVIVLESHADEPGSAEVNSAIARERAEAVGAALVKEGVEKERISIRVFGNQEPLAVCDATPAVGGTPANASTMTTCAGQNRLVITVVSWRGSPTTRRLSATGGRPPQ